MSVLFFINRSSNGSDGALTIPEAEVHHLEGGVVHLIASSVGDGAKGGNAGNTHCVVQVVLWQGGKVSRGQVLHCTKYKDRSATYIVLVLLSAVYCWLLLWWRMSNK